MVVILASVGLYLHSQDKFLPALTILTGPSDIAGVPMTTWVIAFLVALFTLSVLPPKAAGVLALVLALGALKFNNSVRGSNDVLHTLFGAH